MDVTLTLTRYQAELVRRALDAHAENLDDFVDHGHITPKELRSATFERHQVNIINDRIIDELNKQ